MGYVDVAHYSLLTKIRHEGMTKALEWLIPSLLFAFWKNDVVPLNNSYFPFISLSELFLLTEATYSSSSIKGSLELHSRKQSIQTFSSSLLSFKKEFTKLLGLKFNII